MPQTRSALRLTQRTTLVLSLVTPQAAVQKTLARLPARLPLVDAADGDTALTFTVSSDASNGTASIDASTGSWTYTPATHFNGSDSFTVTVTDDDGHEETQVISLTVNPANERWYFLW